MNRVHSAKIWEPIDFTIYFSFVKWFVIAGIVLEILFRIWSSRLSGGLFYEQLEVVTLMIRIIIFALLGWRVVLNFGHSAAVAAMSGAIAGFIFGLAISISRFGSGIAVWKFFNIITETTIITIVGSLIAVLMIYILSFKL